MRADNLSELCGPGHDGSCARSLFEERIKMEGARGPSRRGITCGYFGALVGMFRSPNMRVEASGERKS